MQATRLDTYELTTSDQSLAQPPSKANSYKRNTASDHASDQ